ncbi:hypothetical protein PK28_05160 [Hymenobacter sp. DG25B]|uniref:DUF4249 domain-containing protein n=1 Tax=Hymenobacter sp. DG25B TaxID=1385664 RepID=UPI000540ADDD|nr:DUF4249 domain-containing protein [Hymenobacter sp. DG25B]AIZ63227.1 hypothetical protein PK28_05160 [Hymenobacter sp. DG25B]
MKALFPILASCLLLGLSSCETVVDVPAPKHTPRLALNYVLSNQAPDSLYWQSYPHRLLTVSVSQSVFNNAEVRQPINATVELLDASGQVVERFRGRYRYYNPYTQDSTGAFYEPQYGFAGQPGQRYTLRAALPGLETAESTLELPAPATIGTATFIRRQSNPNESQYFVAGRLSLSVPDAVASTDYYVATARVLDTQGRFWGMMTNDFQNEDPGSDVSVDRFRLSDGYSPRPQVYADLNANGRTLTLAQNVQAYFSSNYNPGDPQNYREPAFIEVTISTLTREAYDFYQSVQRYQDSQGNPFAEPAPLAGNIRNGYGLFGGATDTRVIIPIQ